MDYPDRKIEWNVWTFDQGLASRVPYESAARTLTQSKQSFSGYTVRQGLAITLEHNFMMSNEGMANFHNQVTQVVGSIQNTNDLDVHMALINAPSYLSQVREKYFLDDYLAKSIRDYVDMFGFVQKNMNAVDIIIEDTRALIKNWGGDEPDFILSSGKLTYQLTMTQERTSYYTQGLEGQKLFKSGPDMTMYRGLRIIKSKAFSLSEGSAPRDVLRRRVRVAEFYVGLAAQLTSVSLYDEMADSFNCEPCSNLLTKIKRRHNENDENNTFKSIMLIRPNIEHYMLGVIIGRGGIDHLGATMWGQTEMSVFDDGQHGVWGMTYKYHERAIVFNERNLHRVWDVAYDGYVGGKDMSLIDMNNDREIDQFIEDSNNFNSEYQGASTFVLGLSNSQGYLPSPLLLTDYENPNINALATADMMINDIDSYSRKMIKKVDMATSANLKNEISKAYQKLQMSNNQQVVKDATMASSSNECTNCRLMYQGTSTWSYSNAPDKNVTGSGHHGVDYTRVAAVRNGKQLAATSAPVIGNYNRAYTRALPPVGTTVHMDAAPGAAGQQVV